jgi:Transposase DNA-binding
MESTDRYDLSPFGREHFGAAQLGDKRRTRSLIDQANRLAKHPRGSLPEKHQDPKALRRLYDLMNTQAVTHAAVLQPHVRRTAEVVLQQQGVVLVLHDTTELDFSGLHALHAELGQIGNGHGRGYLCHNSLAVLPGKQVLGLLGQRLHVRANAPKGETPAQRRERENRESLLWLWGVEAVQQATQRAAQRLGHEGLPEGLRVVDICDRGGDTFEFLDYEDLHDRQYVVRSSQDRILWVGHEDGADGQRQETLLHEYLRTLPGVDRRTITVHGRDGAPDRQATVCIAWAAVRLPAPRQQRGHFRKGALRVWAIRVWEENPPAGVEAVEWFLLSNVAVQTVADAWERVDWYTCRWQVEEFHKAQKTGCDIESPQFTTVAALQPTIALLSVVAVSLLDLRTQSRDPAQQDAPATTIMPPEEVEVLSGWRYGQRRPLTVREFFLALARLGGHQNRKGDHPPGWLVLWRGWQALQLMVAGARAANRPLAPPATPTPRKPRTNRRE